MKKLFITLILIFFYPIFSLRAACPDTYPTPKIELYSSYGKLKYDFTKNIDYITKLAKKSKTIQNGLFAAGLTTLKINLDISLNSSIKQNKNYICVYPKDVKISIYYSDPTIYVANHLKPNSCEYNVVLRHEHTHIQINKTALDYFLPLFYKATTDIFKSIKPKQVKTSSQAKLASEQIAQEFNRKFTPLYDYFRLQIFNEQQKLDNDNNYKYESKLCH